MSCPGAGTPVEGGQATLCQWVVGTEFWGSLGDSLRRSLGFQRFVPTFPKLPDAPSPPIIQPTERAWARFRQR